MTEILTYNPGFERSSEALGTPNSGWNEYFDSLNALTRITSDFDTGSACAELSSSGAKTYIGINEFIDVDTKIWVNKLYTVQWRVKVQNTDDYTAQVMNANGANVTIEPVVYALTAGVWSTVTVNNVDFTSWTAGSHEVTFRLNKDGGGTYATNELVLYDTMSMILNTPAIRPDYEAYASR